MYAYRPGAVICRHNIAASASTPSFLTCRCRTRRASIAEQKTNFPGIDLADDRAGVVIQVTATSNLDKVKDTIKTFLEHGLDKKYQLLIIYVLGRRQSGYSQDAINRAAVGRVKLNATDDIFDHRDLCGAAAVIDPKQLAAALEVVREYMRGGVARGLSEEDFDPPDSPPQ